MRLVQVYWEDSAALSHMDWEEPDCTPIQEVLITTVGFLRYEDAYRIELVMSRSDTEIAGRWMIPRGCIRSITDLVEAPNV